MYEQIFGFSSRPFTRDGAPGAILESAAAARALSYVGYGLQKGEGIVVVTGEPGVGCSALLEQVKTDARDAGMQVIALPPARVDGIGLLRLCAADLGFDVEGLDKVALLGAVRSMLAESLAQGRPTLLAIDDAQGLDDSALEELRLLTGQLVDARPTLRIVMVGDASLRDRLELPHHARLRQRIVASCRLGAFTADETRTYVGKRLEAAGWQGRPRFDGVVLGRLHELARGVPAEIDRFCERLILAASIDDADRIDNAMLDLVLNEIASEDIAQARTRDVDPSAAPDSMGALEARLQRVETLVASIARGVARLNARAGGDTLPPDTMAGPGDADAAPDGRD